jgi:hypothetical protein
MNVKRQMTLDFPHAREEELVVKVLGDELLIYDLKRHKAHSLNRTAAWVWNHADGHTSIEQMRNLLEEELKTAVGLEVIRLALGQLQKAHLLVETTAWMPPVTRLSRRDAVRTIGIAAVLLPAVATIFAPKALAVASCKPRNATCTTGSQCCSRVCGTNGRCQ